MALAPNEDYPDGVNDNLAAIITLRNIMLRHHRGSMLMILPYSDLGAITK